MIGQKLGQYTIVELIGTGGMATVYRARQESIKRDVVIKIIQSALAQSPEFVQRFEREAEIVASLSHPHIVKIFDFGREGDLLYIVMELLTGGSLTDRLRSGPLPIDHISIILDQIASALDIAHERGIIHRDLKPQNVLLDVRGNAFLTDFGIAKMLEDTSRVLTATGLSMGTPAYMSPEQWQGAVVDARSDLYSLGIVLFEMLTGQVPFNKSTPAAVMYQHLTQPPPRLSSLRADVPPGIERVLEKVLAKQPDDRYQSAVSLARAFRTAATPYQYLAGATPTEIETVRDGLAAVPPPTPSIVKRPLDPPTVTAYAVTTPDADFSPAPRPSRLPLLLGAAVLVAAIGGGVLLATRDTDPLVTPSAAATTQNTIIAAAPTDAPSPAATETAAVTIAPTTAIPTTVVPTSTIMNTSTAAPTDMPTLQPSASMSAREAALATIGALQTETAAAFTATPTPDFLLTVLAEQTVIALEIAAIAQTETADVVAQFTATPTSTPTPSFTPTDTVTPSVTPLPTLTASFTATYTDTPLPTITPTHTRTQTATPDAAASAAAAALETLTMLQTQVLILAPTTTPVSSADATATVRSKSASSSVRNAEMRATVQALEAAAKQQWGPYSGSLVDTRADSLATFRTDKVIANGIIRVRFYNIPALTGLYGVIFRSQSNVDQYRIFIDYTKRWTWGYGSKSIRSFSSAAIDNSAGGFNDLEVYFKDGDAYVFINNVFANQLDVSELRAAGNITVIAGIYSGQQPTGQTTVFENLTIIELP